MSKYYKAEDVERLIENVINVMIGKEEPIETALCDLPTIEVSEELPKDIVEPIGNGNVIMSEATYDELIERSASEDCISREHLKSFGYINKGNFNSVETIREWIDNAPSVVPKPKEGEWLPIIEATEMGEPYIARIYCSECGETLGCEANYCPNCGAKMKG